MPLITEEIRARLQRNAELRLRFAKTYGLPSRGHPQPDFLPVVKIYTPDGPCTWLLSEVDLADADLVHALRDDGAGAPALCTVRISDLENAAGPIGLQLARDEHFIARKTISAYAAEAARLGRIEA